MCVFVSVFVSVSKMRGRGRKRENALKARITQLEAAAAAAKNGAVQVGCPSDPPPVAVSPWNSITLELPASANGVTITPLAITEWLIANLGVDVKEPTSEWILQITRLAVWGARNAGAAPCEIAWADPRATGGSGTKTTFLVKDRGDAMRRSRVALKPAAATYFGADTTSLALVKGDLFHLSVKWRVASNDQA